MVQLKHKDVRVIDDAFDMQGGYVLNGSVYKPCAFMLCFS